MGRISMPSAMFLGGFIGFVVFALTELCAVLVMRLLLPREVGVLQVGFLFLGGLKSLFLGVPVGQSCGAAVHEWLYGNKRQAVSVCRAAGGSLVNLFLAFYGVIALLFLRPRDFNFASASSREGWIFPILALYLISFPLQIGVFLLLLAHWVQLDSEDTEDLML